MKNKPVKFLILVLSLLMVLVSVNSALAVTPITISNVQHTPTNPTINENVKICAEITSINSLDRVEVTLDNGIDILTYDMNNVEDNAYCKTLSAVTLNAEAGMIVSYHITAEDSESNELTSATYQYTYRSSPTIEILTDSIEINGESYSDNFQVASGEKININFEYKNNLNNQVIGYVTITAKSDQTPDFVNYYNQDWALLPGLFTGSEQFEFTLPYSLRNDFKVTLRVEDEDNQGNHHWDEVDLTFDLSLVPKDVVINSAALSEDQLTCTTNTILNLNLINIGSHNLLPEVVIFTAPATMDHDGNFDQEPLTHFVGTSEIAPGEHKNMAIPLDVSEITGTQKLYVYIISPFFWNSEDGFYPGDQTTVTLTKNSCIKSYTPTKSQITITNEDSLEFSVTLAENGVVEWFVNNVKKEEGTDFLFSSQVNGEYTVKAVVNEAETHTWTIIVAEAQPAAIQVSEILFNSVNRDVSINLAVTIKNSGTTQALTDLSASLTDVDAKYNAELLGALPTTLAAGQETTVTLQIYVPEDEITTKHQIGTLEITSNEAAASAPIFLSPSSKLVIESIEINGKENGEFSLEDINEIEVKVKNEYSKEMNGVVVTAKILDIDDEDIEEESDDFALGLNDDETVTLEFDLSKEKMTEDKYTLEIIVEGEADDDTTHYTVKTVTVNVNRNKHDLIIKEASIAASSIECTSQTALEVKIENVGTSNEENVEIRVRNSALGIDLIKKGIDLNKYSGNDNDYQTSFALNLEDAKAGTYYLDVEIYRDGELADSEELSLEIKDCSQKTSQPQVTTSTENLLKQLQEQLESKTTVDNTIVKTSFRDSDNYVLLLGVLIMLLLVAIILGFAVMTKKK